MNGTSSGWSIPDNGPKIYVSNKYEFEDAVDTLSQGQGGTIVLKSGIEKMQIQLHSKGPENGFISVVSEDPDNPVDVAGVRLIESSNIGFYNLNFDSQDFVRAEWLVDLMVTGGENIEFAGNTLSGGAESILTSAEGRVEDGALVRDVDGFSFQDNIVQGYTYGLSMLDVANVEVSDNEFTKLQGDALNGGGWQNVLIEDNWFHNMFGSHQDVSHSDFIQLWGTNVDTLTDGLTIRGNLLDSGTGPAYQSIFMRHDPGATEDMFHRNILIEDNIIHNGMPNAIRLTETNGVTVQNNTVLWNQLSEAFTNDEHVETYPPQININSIGTVVIEGNIAPVITAQGNVDLSQNVVVDYLNLSSDNHYSKHFVNHVVGGEASFWDLELRPDSDWVGQYGASATQPTTTLDPLTAVATQNLLNNDRSTVEFDAGLSRDASGYLTEDDAEFTWVFANGDVRTGIKVLYDFGDASGLQEYQLQVMHNDGRSSVIDRHALVVGDNIVETNFNDGLEGWASNTQDATDVAFVDGYSGKGLYLDGVSSVAFERNVAFHDLAAFTFSTRLKKTDADGYGHIMDMANNMSLSIDANGHVLFDLYNQDGDHFLLKSDTAVMRDTTDWHQIDVTYNSSLSQLTLYVDGTEVGEMSANGLTPSYSYWGMVLGTNPWRKGLEAVIDDVAFRAEALSPGAIDVSVSDAPVVVEPEPIVAEPVELPSGGIIVETDFSAGLNGWASDNVDASDVRFVQGYSGQGLYLDGSSAIALQRSTEFHDLEEFTFSIRIKKSDADGHGHIMDMGHNMGLSIDSDGYVLFDLTTQSGGLHVLASDSAVMDNTTDWHQIDITYDSRLSELTLYVDGVNVGEMSAAGLTPSFAYWGMVLGTNPWRDGLEGVVDNVTFRADALSADQVAAQLSGTGSTTPTVPDAPVVQAPDASTAIFETDFSAGLNGWASDRVDASDVTFVQGYSGQGLYLDGDSAIALERSGAFHDLEEFTFSIRVKKSDADGHGHIMDMGKNMGLMIDHKGNIVFDLYNEDDDLVLLKSDSAVMDNTTDWHQIDVTYDSALAQLTLYFDGVEAGSTVAYGDTPSYAYWGMVLGTNPWRDGLEGVVDDVAFRAEALSADQIAAQFNGTASASPVASQTSALLAAIVETDFDAGLGDWVSEDVDENDVNLVQGYSGQGLYLDGDSSIALERSTEFHELEEFTFSTKVKKSDADGHGHIMDMGHNMGLMIEDDGQIVFDLYNEAGDRTFVKSDAMVMDNTTDWHQIDVTYDSALAQLTLYFDGVEAGSAAAHGDTPSYSYWGMVLGTNPWRDGLEGVIDDVAFRAEALSADQIAAQFSTDFL